MIETPVLNPNDRVVGVHLGYGWYYCQYTKSDDIHVCR